MNTIVKTGLDRLIDDGCQMLHGRRIALLCHAASVASDLRHITQVFRDASLNGVRCFGPEHGIWADAQDMIAVTEEPIERMTGAPVKVSMVPMRRVSHLARVTLMGSTFLWSTCRM